MRTRILHSIRCIFPTRFLRPSSLVTMALLSVFAVAVWALTAPTTIFELDGDSATGSTYGVPNSINCDWDTLNGGKTANSNTPTAVCAAGGATLGAYGFLVGLPGEPNFQTGGSKDALDVSSWAFASTSSPDKDTLTHGYAAAYTGPASGGSDNILVFGAERFSVSGDSNIGIWFFQNLIGTTGGSKGTFTGVHVTGDILIVSAFSGGGSTSTISVYQWNPAACPNSHYSGPTTSGQQIPPVCADTNLLALFFDQTIGATSICTSSSPACALVNAQSITLGWPYAAKFNVGSNVVPPAGFYEGGIDLSALLPSGQNAPCFASFLFETRSSQSTSAVLKDFLVGSFPECHMSMSKTVTCNSFNADNTFNYSYVGSVINDGGGGLFNVQVTDVKGQTYSCGGLSKGASKTFGGSPLSGDCSITTGNSATFTTAQHPATNEATATADTSQSGTSPPISADTGSVTSSDATDSFGNSLCNPHPDIDVAKRCVTGFQVAGGQIVIRVDFTGEVINSGQLNLTSVTVTDDAGATPPLPSLGGLLVGQSKCYTNGQIVSPGPPATGCPTLSVVNGLSSTPTGAASYFPNAANITMTPVQGRIEFTDTVTATGTASSGASVGPKTASAHCVICPFGSCPAQ